MLTSRTSTVFSLTGSLTGSETDRTIFDHIIGFISVLVWEAQLLGGKRGRNC